ncbi:MAG: hypothetical protein IAF08_13155 [Rhizobacter sp.]|nr:hypothetical protein [Chlorobiales bacterium]
METHIRLLDRIHLQKYIYLISLFVSEQIEVADFEKVFLEIRNEDTYLMSGLFDESVGRVLGTFYLDVSDHTPDDLFDPNNDTFDITTDELRRRASEALGKLKDITSESFSRPSEKK